MDRSHPAGPTQTLADKPQPPESSPVNFFPLGLQFFLLGFPLHAAGGPCGLWTSRCCLALGPQLFGLLAVELEEAPTVRVRI